MSRGLRIYEEHFVERLVVHEDTCIGLVTYDLQHGSLEGFLGKAVLLATGGSGRVYGRSTSALINTGAGAALAYHAGVPLRDMEFVQFHPTTLFGTNILMSEGCRGEGGYLVNRENERFMGRYAPSYMELAPRDVVARSIQTEIDEGRGIDGEQYVYLDLRHLGEALIDERLPGIRDLCIHFAGVDPVVDPVPCSPDSTTPWGVSTRTSTGRRSWRACSRPASAPASRSTERTGSAATRCWRRLCSAAVRVLRPPASSAAAAGAAADLLSRQRSATARSASRS